MCLYGVSLCIPVYSGPFPVHSSSRAGIITGSEHLGIRGLPHVAGVSRENIGNRVYMAHVMIDLLLLVVGHWDSHG